MSRTLDDVMADLKLAPLGSPARAASPLTPRQAVDLVHLEHFCDASASEYHAGGVRTALVKAAADFRDHGRLDAAQRAEISVNRLDHIHGPAPAADGARHN
jgi:hypothetical protein